MDDERHEVKRYETGRRQGSQQLGDARGLRQNQSQRTDDLDASGMEGMVIWGLHRDTADMLRPCAAGSGPGSAADGHGIPASFNARVIRAALCPASRWANIHVTTGGCGRVGFEAVGAPAPHGMRLVRMRPRITEPVPVRRTAAQVPALLLVWAAIAVRTRILVRVISRLDESPSTVIVFSSCSDA